MHKSLIYSLFKIKLNISFALIYDLYTIGSVVIDIISDKKIPPRMTVNHNTTITTKSKKNAWVLLQIITLRENIGRQIN